MKYTRRAPKRVFRRKRRATYKRKGFRRTPLFAVKRTMVESYYTLSNAWAGAQWQFRLDKLPDYAEFNTMFTHYRINAVKMTFMPLLDNIDATAQLNSTKYITTPRLYAYVDRDSQPPLATENAVIQHSGLKIVRNPLRPFSIYCKAPAVAEGLATTNSVAYAGLKTKQWISCDSPSVVHNGVVTGGVIPFTGTGASLAYNVIVTYYMQFKGIQ